MLTMGLLGNLGISIMVSGEITKITAIYKSYYKIFKYSNRHENCIKNIVPDYIKIHTWRK